jgi:cell division protein FtsA
MRKRLGQLIVGLDVGSSKVCAVIAEQNDLGTEIIGLGTHPSSGLSKGVIVDIEATTQAITRAIEEAEKMAQVHTRSAFVGLSTTFIKGLTSEGMLPLRGRVVTADDMERVVEAAAAVAIPKDSEVLHVLPQEYILDDLGGIKDPTGMQGMRLEVNCYIVTVQSANIANLVQCCRQSGLEIDGVILEPLASAEAVLSAEERELGAALIDLGGGTTSVLVFKNNAVKHATVLSFGGKHVTTDIARCLHLNKDKAEWLKKRYGHCQPAVVMPGDEIEVEGVDDGAAVVVEHRELCEIIEARVAEILQLVNAEIVRSGMDRYLSSVVLTGGGGHLRGIEDLAASTFNRHVRVGVPRHIGGLVDVVSSPAYASAVGLVLFGSRDLGLSKYGKPDDPLFGRMSRNLKTWVTKLIK